MNCSFETSLKSILKHEGGFVNHPKDPGGMTNLGCTKAVYEAHMGHFVTEEVMKALLPSDVAPIYKKNYWDRIVGDMLPVGLDYAVFDAAINSGSSRASKWLQQVIGTTIDGSIGPKTLKILNACDVAHTITKFNNIRLEFLESLPTWETFGKGWERRVMDVQSKATKMYKDVYAT